MTNPTETTRTIHGIRIDFWLWTATEADQNGYGEDTGGGPGWFWAATDQDASGPYGTLEEAIEDATEMVADWA
jgi:hypothetical protein